LVFVIVSQIVLFLLAASSSPSVSAVSPGIVFISPASASSLATSERAHMLKEVRASRSAPTL
jgi:hypothetical protein